VPKTNGIVWPTGTTEQVAAESAAETPSRDALPLPDVTKQGSNSPPPPPPKTVRRTSSFTDASAYPEKPLPLIDWASTEVGPALANAHSHIAVPYCVKV
jgi:hypothetical protein